MVLLAKVFVSQGDLIVLVGLVLEVREVLKVLVVVEAWVIGEVIVWISHFPTDFEGRKCVYTLHTNC